MQSISQKTKKFNRVLHTTVEYEKFKTEYRLFEGYFEDRCIYSVSVSIYENGTLSDEEFAFDITSSKKAAREIFAMLCKNFVTPCTLFECLEIIIQTV